MKRYSGKRGAETSLIPILLIILIIGSVGTLFVYFPNTLPFAVTAYPTNPFFNPGAGYLDFKYSIPIFGASTSTITINTCGTPSTAFAQLLCPSNVPLYKVSAGTLYAPIGVAAQKYHECAWGGGLFGCGQVSELYWYLKLPTTISDLCLGTGFSGGTCTDTRGFDLIGTIAGASGGILLTSAAPAGDPTCTNYSGSSPDPNNEPSSSCWLADYSLVQQAQAINPPCATGVTACLNYTTTETLNDADARAYLLSQGYNSTEIDSILAQGPVEKNNVQTWYIYRLITAVQLQITPPDVDVQCKLIQGACNPTCPLFSICTGPSPTDDLRSAVTGSFLPSINSVARLTNARISFGVSVTGFAPSSVHDWFGIAGMWIGGQGVQTAGCTGSNSCAFVQSSHTQMALFQDEALTMPASIPSAGDILDLALVTNQTVQSVQQQNTYSTVYTYIDATSLGVQYTYAGDSSCTPSTISVCINVPVPIRVNVPLLYDVIGSYTSFWYQYPGIPPPGGSNSGSIGGRVYDAGSKNLFGSYSGILGACVGVNGPCSGLPEQFQAVTGQGGAYSIPELPEGVYNLYANANGFNTFLVPGIQVSIGSRSTIDFYLTSVIPPGQICIIPPIPGLPFQPPLFGGLCFPSVWLVYAGIAGGGILLGLIALSPAGQAVGFSFAGRRALRKK
jgi:hypothetical protein